MNRLTFLTDEGLVVNRDLIVSKFNASTDESDRSALQDQADSFNKYIDANDIDVRSISFVCGRCGAYANDRRNGIALCDDGHGLVNYEMIVI